MRADAILKSLLLAVLLLGTLNLAGQIYRAVEAANAQQRLYDKYGVIACKLGPSRDESSRFLLELGLLLALMGRFFKRCAGQFISLFGLLWSVSIYALWWQYYFRLIEVSEAGNEAIPHLFYLYNAVWFDLCIAALLPVLLTFQAIQIGLSLTVRNKIR